MEYHLPQQPGKIWHLLNALETSCQALVYKRVFSDHYTAQLFIYLKCVYEISNHNIVHKLKNGMDLVLKKYVIYAQVRCCI